MKTFYLGLILFWLLPIKAWSAPQISSLIPPQVKELNCTDPGYKIHVQDLSGCKDCKKIVSKLKTDIKKWVDAAAAQEAQHIQEAEQASANAVQESNNQATQVGDQTSDQQNMSGAKEAMLKQVVVARDLAQKIRHECVDKLDQECMSKTFQGSTDAQNVSDLRQKCDDLAKQADKIADDKQAEADKLKDKEDQAKKNGEGMSPPGMPEMPQKQDEKNPDASNISDAKKAEDAKLGGVDNKPYIGHIMGIDPAKNEANKKLGDILSPFTGTDPLDKDHKGDNKLYGGSGSSRLGVSGGSGGGGATGAASKILDVQDNPEQAKLAEDGSSYGSAGGGGPGYRAPAANNLSNAGSFDLADDKKDKLEEDDYKSDTYASNESDKFNPSETLFYRIHQKIKERAFTERL